MNHTATTAEETPSVPRASYGQLAARGMAWTTGVVMVGRVSGFLTSLVVGWLLDPSDFGIYAMAIGVAMVALTVRSIGVHRLLIQRGAEYEQLAQPFARLSLYINLAAMLLLGMSGPAAAAYFRVPTLIPLLWIIGLTMPLAVPAEILRSRLAIDLRFRAVALTNAVAMIGTQLMTIVFALGGFGPYSFAVPMALGAALDSLILIGYVGRWPQGRRLDWQLTRELTSSTTWILLCGLAAAVVVHGSNIVVGRQMGETMTGLYYFGAQLTASVAIFFTTTMYRVLLPVMSRLAGDPQRQGDAYLKSIRVLATGAAPVSGLGVAVGAAVIHICWSGKWDDSIAVFRTLTSVLPIFIMTVIGTALLEGRGLWRTNTLLHAAYAVVTLAAAWLGTYFGSIAAVAICVGVGRALFTLVHGCLLMRMLDRRSMEFVRAVVPPWAICSGIAWLVIFLFPAAFIQTTSEPALSGASPFSIGHPWVSLILSMVTYGLIVVAAFGLLMRGRFMELLETVRALRRGRPPVADAIQEEP